MKSISIGHYVGTIGNVVLEHQTFIKKLLNTLQLIQPQSKEFSNQINKLKEEFEEKIENQNIEPNDCLAEFDTAIPQIQKDLQSIHVQLRVLKSANASSRKGQGQPDLTAIEKNKKLKQSFKEYKAESSSQITDIKSALSELKNELKNSHEMMTNIQANLQASRDEFDTFKSKVPSEDDKEEMNSQVGDMQVELEAIKTVLEVMHQGTATTEDLEKMKKSQTRSVNILKNSMQNIKDEIKNIKLLKQGKIPTNVLDLVDSLDQSVNTLQDDMEGIKKDVDDKSSVLIKAQQDLESLMSEMERLKANPIEVDTSALPINDRIGLIEDRMNSLADNQLKTVNNYNAQRSFLKYLKDEFAAEIVERVNQIEKRLDESPIGDSSQTLTDQKNLENDEYHHLDQKLEQMIQDLETSTIQERSANIQGEKPDFPRTVGELRSFQKALRAQAQGDDQSIYQYIEPSNLPLVVQSMDQLLNEMYSEMYQIRDKLTNDISELKQQSSAVKCLKHEVASIKKNLDTIKGESGFVSRDVDLNGQSGSMQWPVLRSPGRRRAPNPFVEGLKSKIQDLVQDMSNAEDQEDDDINQIKPTMGETQAKLNNMLQLCNNIIDYEEEDQIEQVTPEKMWQTINELQEKVTVIKEKAEVQESLDKIDERMSSISERINEISGNQNITNSTLDAHSNKIREQGEQIQDKLNHIEELEKTLNDFISNNAENDHQSIESMKTELEELKEELNNMNKAHEETDNTINSQITEIHQKLKEFEEGAFFKSSPRANPIVQALQQQISELIRQMEDSQIKDEEDTTGELRPNLSQAQEQLETVQRTLDEILAEENERLNMESPSKLVKEIQSLNNRLRMLEGRKPVVYLSSGDLQGQTIEDGEALTESLNNIQTRGINFAPEQNTELVYELKDKLEMLENKVDRLTKGHQDTAELVNKRHQSLKKVKSAVKDKIINKLEKIEDDLNHHITDHPISQSVQVTAPPDSYVKSKPNPVIESLKQQIEDLIQEIQNEELESISQNELSESNGNLKPELDTLKERLTKLQETLQKLQEQQIYVPTHESLQGITDTINALQEKVNNQSNKIRELKDESEVKNNERLDQINEEIKALKRQQKAVLQNEENLTNQIQDAVLPLSQKIEALERRASKGGNIPLDSSSGVIERSAPGLIATSSNQQRKKSGMNSIEALKSSIDALVEKMDDEKLNEEEDTTGELHNNIGQTRKDLAALQDTITALLNRANETDFLTNGGVTDMIQDLQQRVAKLEGENTEVFRSRDIKLDDSNEDEVNQLKENIERLNAESEEFKEAIKSLNYEIKQLKSSEPQQHITEEEEDHNEHNDNIQLSEMTDENNNNNKDEKEDEVKLLRQELDDLRNQVNDLIRGSTSNFFGHSQSKRKRSQIVAEMKDQVDHLLTDMSDPNIQIEAGASEELKPSMDQAQEDLEKLQATLDNIISQPIAESTVLTPEGIFKLIQENQSKIQVLAITEETVNNDIFQIRETLRCLKHEVKKMKENEGETPQDGFTSWLAESGKNHKEPNPAVLAIQSQIDILSKQLDESDLTESDNFERDLNGKVTQTQENLKSLRQALQSILDADDSDEITPDNLVPTIRELQAKSILMNQEMENAQRTIDSLSSELKKLKDEVDEQAQNKSLEENIDIIRTRVEEVSANQIKTEDNVNAQSTKLREYKEEINQIKSDLTEIKEIISQAEEQGQERAAHLEEAISSIKCLKHEFKKFKENDIQDEIKSRVAQLEQNVESIEETNNSFVSWTPLKSSKKVNPRHEELKNQIDVLVTQMEDPSLVEDDTQGELNPAMDKAKDELHTLRELLQHFNDADEFNPGQLLSLLQRIETRLQTLEESKDQQEQIQLQTRDINLESEEKMTNLEQSFDTLKTSLDDFKERLGSTVRNEEEMEKNVEELNKQIQDLQNRLGDVESQPSQIIAGFNTFKKRPINPSIEALKQKIEEFMKQMNDPEIQKDDDESRLKPTLSSTEAELRQLQETLKRLMEQEEPVAVTPESLLELIHQLQAQVTQLDVIQSTSETEEKIETINQDLNSFNERIQSISENQLKLINSFNSFKSRFDQFEEQILAKENEYDEKIGDMSDNINDLQSHVNELEEHPAQLMTGFAAETHARPVNPVIKGIQKRIDELVAEMNDPSLKDEEDQSQEELQSNMSKAEAELLELRETIKRLMEQEEPIVITPESLLEMLHSLQAQVASLEVKEAQRSRDVQNGKLANLHAQNQEKVYQSLDYLKLSLDGFRDQLLETNINEQEIDNNINNLCSQIEGIQNTINEYEEQPSPMFSEFSATQRSAAPNPAMEGIQKRIDELIKEMNHPSLQNEDSEANTRLKPSMTKAEKELIRLQETLKKLEEEDQITPYKLYDMIQSIQNKLDDHIENHPSQWTVMPREKKASPVVHDLKQSIDDLFNQMQTQTPALEEGNETKLKPSMEKAENELRELQNKINNILEQQDQPTVLTPESLYASLLDLQSSLTKMRKEQIQQAAIQERSIQLEPQFDAADDNEDEEMDDEQWKKATSRKISRLQRSIAALVRHARANNNNNSNEQQQQPFDDINSSLEEEVASLKSSVEQIKSEMNHLHNLQSPAKEYRSLLSAYTSNPPKSEEELVSYIDRLEKVAEGFDRHIIAAQEEIKKVGQIKNYLKEDSEFAKSLENEIKKHSSAIHCIKHELKNLMQNNGPSSNAPVMARSINFSLEDGDESGKDIKDRLSKLENKVDSFKATYVGFNQPNEDPNEEANRTASIEALKLQISKFVERNIEPDDDDEDVEKLQPDIQKTQNQLRELNGTLDDILQEHIQYEQSKVTPQRLNESLLDVKQEVDEIKHKIQLLDQNQAQAFESFNNFKNEVESLPKFTQEILDYINTLPREISQISANFNQSINELKSEIEEIKRTEQENVESITQKIESVNHSVGCVKYEVKTLKNQVPEIQSDIKSIQEDINNHSNEITSLHDKDASLSETINEMKSESAQIQEQNAQQFNEINDKLSSATTEIEIMKSTNEQNQQQNQQQFKEINDKLASTTTEIEVMKSTNEQIQQQNQQQFTEIKDSISSINNEIEEMKSENAQIHERNAIEFQNINDKLSSLSETIEEVKSQSAQVQEQNARQFKDINDKLSSTTTEIEVMKSTNEQIQQQNHQQFSEIDNNLSSINKEIEEIKSENAQTNEKNAVEFQSIKDNISTISQTIEEMKEDLNNKVSSLSDQLNENIITTNSSIEKLNSDVARYHDEANQTTENLNNLINQHREDQKKVDRINNDVETLKSTTNNLTDEIGNLKAMLKEHEERSKQKQEEERAKVQKIVSQLTKHDEYNQKVLAKHEKNMKSLIERQKGIEDLIQTNDPVSKDDFQKLEMKYDKLIEQIHSNISVIANGQQTQQESFKKELNNLSQNNSELQSEASLTGGHKEGVEDLTKKITKIFKHVKSQDEKINKLRTDVDTLLNA